MKPTKLQVKNLLKKIQETDFYVEIDYGNELIQIRESYGNFELEFSARYSVSHRVLFAQTYLTPEEAEATVNMLEISDICVYYKDDCAELADSEIQEIKNILESKIID